MYTLSLNFKLGSHVLLFIDVLLMMFQILLDSLTRFLPELSSDFRAGQQEDAHEFLRCLLDNLHKCTLDPKSKGKPSSFDEESIVKQVFGGRLKSQVCTLPLLISSLWTRYN